MLCFGERFDESRHGFSLNQLQLRSVIYQSHFLPRHTVRKLDRYFVAPRGKTIARLSSEPKKEALLMQNIFLYSLLRVVESVMVAVFIKKSECLA